MSYEVNLSKGALKQINKLPPELRLRIQARINDLAIQPRPDGVKKLKGKENGYRIRVGDYRVLYNVFDDAFSITIVRIENRSDVYKYKS
ncbi:addiction module antitoxin [Calothrix sp. NIES-2100]|uniref:type II toxin-antitoxin system RelE family toxin n=1 Tax=Calothrix sp. NIES-2100 TaxID=1954172 RepID=UPI000B61E095|nr:addiction module antitoxin [Calothrix sp. NIES-2100]